MRVRSKISSQAYENKMTILELFTRTILREYNLLVKRGEIPCDNSCQSERTIPR